MDFALSPFFKRFDFLCFESSESLDELSLDDVEDDELLLLLLLLSDEDVELDDDELSLDELDELKRRQTIKTIKNVP